MLSSCSVSVSVSDSSILSVNTSFVRDELFTLSTASPDKTPCVTYAYTSVAPFSKSAFDAFVAFADHYLEPRVYFENHFSTCRTFTMTCLITSISEL